MIKVSNDRCSKALDDFADLIVLCQVGRFMHAFCFQFLMIFRCFGIFHIDRTGFLHLHTCNTRISCGSCKPFKSTYKSFASLNRVQIWNLSSKTWRIAYTREKRRYLTQSCDKSPYTHRKFQKAT